MGWGLGLGVWDLEFRFLGRGMLWTLVCSMCLDDVILADSTCN